MISLEASEQWLQNHNWAPSLEGWVLGGTTLASPAIASWGGNRLDVFVRGTNGRINHRWVDGLWLDNWLDTGRRERESSVGRTF